MLIESIANIECVCGEKFQVLNGENNDWDEKAIASLYEEHLKSCMQSEGLN